MCGKTENKNYMIGAQDLENYSHVQSSTGYRNGKFSQKGKFGLNEWYCEFRCNYPIIVGAWSMATMSIYIYNIMCETIVNSRT